MAAAERGLDVATQNLAGASCDGFHRMVLFASLGPKGIVTSIAPDAQSGALRRTNRELDLAASGTARFRLNDNSTRATVSCERTLDGHLQTADGRRLLGRDGALHFPLQARIESDGTITRFGAIVDRLALTQPGLVEQGVVEGANTDSMHAMIEVLEAQRHFETAQKATQTIDAVSAKDASEIGRAAQ